MTLDYSIIAFKALNILVLMTIPIQHFDCFVNSFSISLPARAVHYFSYTTPQIMCELGVFPIFLREGERSFKSGKNPSVDFF